MKTFSKFFKIELKRLFKIIPGATAIIFFALAMFFIMEGTLGYKDKLDKKEEFKKIEQAKVKKHYNYTIYGMQGFRILFMPRASNIFFMIPVHFLS
jgi:hypothetical protein